MKEKWANYYVAYRKFWFDPSISVLAKAVVRVVDLHRSDEQGWSLSIRKIAGYLKVSKNNAGRAINEAISRGYLQASTTEQRKRRKLRLSVSLRQPVSLEKYVKKFLVHPVRQVGSTTDTEVGSPRGTVNNKGNNKTNKAFEGKHYERLKEVVSRLPPAQRN
jgi:DNA-binding transcriptional MocR family regulator